MATVYQADITNLVRPHLEKAEQKGIEKGKAEGEHKKAVETAKKRKAYGDSVEKIKEITGLSKEEINSL